MKIINQLRVARNELELDNFTYICHVLEWHDAHEAIDYINSVIPKTPMTIKRGIAGWLIEQGHITLKEYHQPEMREKLRLYRIAFIDHLIEELSCKKSSNT